jgi:DNA-binding response OmpR family regulator
MALRDGLKTCGFGQVIAAKSIEDMANYIEIHLVDLIICDAEMDNHELATLSRIVRHGQLGLNPYVSVIATSREPTQENVKRLIDAGVDSLLAKPIAMTKLLHRIESLTHSRSAFSVTPDYVGPDRRIGPRDETSPPLIEVPNSLLEKVEGSFDEETFLADVKKTNASVNEQKAVQHSDTIKEIVQQIIPYYKSDNVDDRIVIHLNHLLRAAVNLSKRLSESNAAHISELCRSLVPITENILKHHLEPSQKDLKLLQEVSLAIHMALRTEGGLEGVSHDIAASIVQSGRFGGD